MNILVDFAHPAHFHFFSSAIRRWRDEGHELTLTARRKDVLLELLRDAGEEAVALSGIRRGRVGQMAELLRRIRVLVPLIRKKRIDVLTAVGGVSVAHAAWLCRRPSLIWTNNENARLSNRITLPFATRIATPRSFVGDYGRRHLRYRGNHERAYVDPDSPAPPREVLHDWGLDPGRLLFVVRLVSWQASHDRGHQGLGLHGALELIRRLEGHGQVALSVEGECPPELRDHLRPIPPLEMRKALALASLYIGEGATMASEAALMGVPSIFFSTIRLGYLEELEREFGLLRCLSNREEAFGQIEDWLGDSTLGTLLAARRNRFFEETDRVADLVHDWVLETGP
ncbi:MAG: DUF354 domain-containing protein [Candidatus Omnitrophica bacterium]|nr:DUF354 domain-containing protein [Candidatus Omnitrophota bacterium]